jgi:hypothetical protein
MTRGEDKQGPPAVSELARITIDTNEQPSYLALFSDGTLSLGEDKAEDKDGPIVLSENQEVMLGLLMNNLDTPLHVSDFHAVGYAPDDANGAMRLARLSLDVQRLPRIDELTRRLTIIGTTKRYFILSSIPHDLGPVMERYENGWDGNGLTQRAFLRHSYGSVVWLDEIEPLVEVGQSGLGRLAVDEAAGASTDLVDAKDHSVAGTLPDEDAHGERDKGEKGSDTGEQLTAEEKLLARIARDARHALGGGGFLNTSEIELYSDREILIIEELMGIEVNTSASIAAIASRLVRRGIIPEDMQPETVRDLVLTLIAEHKNPFIVNVRARFGFTVEMTKEQFDKRNAGVPPSELGLGLSQFVVIRKRAT